MMHEVSGVVVVWQVIYDFNADSFYIFTNFQSVKNAVISSIATYCDYDDDVAMDFLTSCVEDKLEGLQTKDVIPIFINNLTITIYRFVMDESTEINKVLRECYSVVDDKLKARISNLFSWMNTSD